MALKLTGEGEVSSRKDSFLLRGGPRPLSHRTIATDELTLKNSPTQTIGTTRANVLGARGSSRLHESNTFLLGTIDFLA